MRIQYYHKKDNSSVVTGLCGANCYHDYYPVVPGISKPTYTPEEIEEFNRKENEPVEYNGKKYTKYEATQRQRKLETTMRAQRQEIKLLKEGGANEDDLIAARSRYRGTSAEYARFSKAMDLPQQRERVTVDGLGNIGQGKYKADTPSEAKQEAPQQTQDTQKGISPVEQKNAVQSSTEADNINNKSVDNGGESGIINIEIDELTPCLRDNKTGELVETEVRQIIDYNELKECTPQNGWDFTWDKPPKDSEVYAVSVKDSTEIEGLIALRSEPNNDAVYMYWGNAAPHNRITDNNTEKKYNGVGGHLFAVAIHKSLQNGFGGVIYADAANKELLSHFINEHGAFPIGTHEHPYRFLLDGESAKNLFKTYNFDWR